MDPAMTQLAQILAGTQIADQQQRQMLKIH